MRCRAQAAGDAEHGGAPCRRPAGRRLRVQGLGGPVPHVDARCVRGRADDRDGVHVDGVKAAAFAAFGACSCRRSSRSRRSGSRCCRRSPALTMIVGTVVGVVQTNVKRMLAYSSIAHAGYLLLGIVVGERAGKAAILFYLLAYAVTNIGALGIVALLGTARAPARRAARFRRAVADAAGPRRADDDVPAVARRLPADRGLHRQVVHLQRRGAGRTLLARHHRRADERRVGVLLSSHRRHDVHDRRLASTARRRLPRRSAGLALAVIAVLYLGILPTRVLDLALDSISTIF